MRPAISTNPETGSSRFQADDEVNDDLANDISYREALGCLRSDYERQDVARPKPAPMAQVSWSTAEQMRQISDCAFAIEAYRRGQRLVSANQILSGTHHDSGKKRHKRKTKSQRGN